MTDKIQQKLDALYANIGSLRAWLENSRHAATALRTEIRSLREQRGASALARLESEHLVAVSRDEHLADSILDRRVADRIEVPILVVAKCELCVGQPTVVEGAAPKGHFSVVFSDDGEAGYFYALETSLGGEKQIGDALHVYSVADAADAKPSIVEVSWTGDGTKAALLIDGCVQAVFDFRAKRGFCRTGFPPEPLSGEWSICGHAWDEVAVAPFA